MMHVYSVSVQAGTIAANDFVIPFLTLIKMLWEDKLLGYHDNNNLNHQFSRPTLFYQDH